MCPHLTTPYIVHMLEYRPITAWADDDRPREKLLSKGCAALSNAELIAILIGSGTRELSAVDLAKAILNDSQNDLNSLGRKNIQELMRFKGIGEAKAISIVAAMELGKRRRLAAAKEKQKIGSSIDAFELLQPLIGDLQHEEFRILMLNRSNEVIQTEQVSSGGVTATVVDARIIFKRALDCRAVALIVAHNHPSGSLEPSAADRQLTEKLREGGRLLEIPVLDHLIITEHGYFSFADEGLL